MAKVIIKDSSRQAVHEIMNGWFVVDIEFRNMEEYEEAVINGFDREKFKIRNPGMKILINKNQLWEIR
jgi:hypothetical protein